jgi:hypothetical protein
VIAPAAISEPAGQGAHPRVTSPSDRDTLCPLSPTIFRTGPYRFFFFSLEEDRVHVHVVSPDGEAKFWLEPIVALATSTGFSPRHLRRLQHIVEERQHEIHQTWNRHFKR